jgi:putative sigma-54 modulation protein
MKIEITSRHEAISDALRDYALQRLTRVEHLGTEFPSAEIVFDQGREGLTCEIILQTRRGEPIVARAAGHEARAAVDTAVGKIEAQVAKAKDRRDDRRKAS